MKDVSVILPVYVFTEYLGELTKKCLEHLRLGTNRADYQLVVVADACTYAVEEMKAAADIYIEHPKPLGWAHGVNLAVASTSTTYLVFINNDLFVPPGWLPRMKEIMDKHPECGSLAPDLGYGIRESNWIRDDDHFWSLVMMKRSVWEVVGPLDEVKLNHRYADQDMSIRIKLAGFEVLRTGDVMVEHVIEATHGLLRNEALESQERAEMIRRYGYKEFRPWLWAGGGKCK